MKNIFLFILLFLVSCNEAPPETEGQDTVTEKNSSPDSLRKLLMGKWGGDELGTPPGFEVRRDSIFLYHLGVAHPYKLNGDTLIVHNLALDTSIIWGRVSIKNDSLLIKDLNGNFTTYAFRNKE